MTARLSIRDAQLLRAEHEIADNIAEGGRRLAYKTQERRPEKAVGKEQRTAASDGATYW